MVCNTDALAIGTSRVARSPTALSRWPTYDAVSRWRSPCRRPGGLPASCPKAPRSPTGRKRHPRTRRAKPVRAVERLIVSAGVLELQDILDERFVRLGIL